MVCQPSLRNQDSRFLHRARLYRITTLGEPSGNKYTATGHPSQPYQHTCDWSGLNWARLASPMPAPLEAVWYE
eukprot:2784206-Amphidinium_carterae.1